MLKEAENALKKQSSPRPSGMVVRPYAVFLLYPKYTSWFGENLVWLAISDGMASPWIDRLKC